MGWLGNHKLSVYVWLTPNDINSPPKKVAVPWLHSSPDQAWSPDSKSGVDLASPQTYPLSLFVSIEPCYPSMIISYHVFICLIRPSPSAALGCLVPLALGTSVWQRRTTPNTRYTPTAATIADTSAMPHNGWIYTPQPGNSIQGQTALPSSLSLACRHC